MTIVETGEYDKLLINGERATPDECYEHWETLIRQNNKTNGSLQYTNYLDHLLAHNSLLRDYNCIKASLIRLCFAVDDSDIQYLAIKGYRIDITNSDTYAVSLTAAFRKSDNLITRINMKLKQIEALGKKTVNNANPTFNSLMANLIHHGYSVDENIKLAVYSEIKKLVDKDVENGRGIR